MRLPTWILPAGLAAIVVGAVLSTRQKGGPTSSADPIPGDVVSVRADRFFGGAPNVVVPGFSAPGVDKLAILVSEVRSTSLGGTVVGYEDASGKLVLGIDGTSPYVTFPASEVVSLWHEHKKI